MVSEFERMVPVRADVFVQDWNWALARLVPFRLGSVCSEVDNGSLREQPSSKSVRVALTKSTMVPCGNGHRRRARE
ncbi:hypothetical protein [Paenibacillus sp. CCS19]|uniref:hypothetical protein n=1 Tax=Paenibacillus sp. CCS19 TaxID=3158387 RepID=UPI00295F1B16|nr:hypothetical protein [Paenibacillus cellulosilyticus]